MLRAACGILAKAAVLLLGLAGKQRRIRLTATIAFIDIALLPQHFVSESHGHGGPTNAGGRN